MKQVLTYVWLVIKRSFGGVFLLADAFGLAFLLLSAREPNVPVWSAAIIFGIILSISSYMVWLDEIREKLALKAKLDEIKNSIPEYSIDSGAIEKFTISPIINNVSDGLINNEAKIKKQDAASASNAAVASIFKSLNKLATMPLGLGGETLEERSVRLAEHLESLEEYEKELTTTYLVPLYFKATRSDSNVEIQLKLQDEGNVIVEDSYPVKNKPTTYEPKLLHGMVSASLVRNMSITSTNSIYSHSFADEDGAFSKLKKINASRTYDLFDEGFYIQSKKKSVELEITIHSEKLQTPQVVKHHVNLSNPSITRELTIGEEE